MKLKKGQIVYVLGHYKARVVDSSPYTVTCDVYEGLAPGQKAPQRASYAPVLIEPKKR